MYYKTNKFLQKLSDNTILQLTRYFGKNEFFSRDRLIKNLMEGGNPKLIETDGEDFDNKTIEKNSFLKLFGSNVFVSKIDNNIDGTDCIQISFPKTKLGNQIYNSKLIDIKQLNKSAESIEEIRANYIFIPSHVVDEPGKSSYLAICNQEVISEKTNPNRPYYFNRVSTTRNGLLGPHNKGIGSLLNCIITGSKYLSEHNMDVSSLALSDIFHLGSKHGFLITEYEKLGAERKFSREIHHFVVSLNRLYENFINRLVRHKQRIQKNIDTKVREVTYLKKNFPDRQKNINKLSKSIEVLKKTLSHNVVILENNKSNTLMPAINEHLLPFVKTKDKTPEEVYSEYHEHIYPLLFDK